MSRPDLSSLARSLRAAAPFTLVTPPPSAKIMIFKGTKRVGELTGTRPILFTQSLAMVPTAVQQVAVICEALRTKDGQRVDVTSEVFVKIDPEAAFDRFDLTVHPETLTYKDPKARSKFLADVNSAVRQVVRDVVSSFDVGVISQSINDVERQANDKFEDLKEELSARGFTIEGNLTIQKIEPSDSKLRDALEAPVREKAMTAADDASAARRLQSARKDEEYQLKRLDTQKKVAEEREEVIKAEAANALAEAKAEAEAEKARNAIFEGLGVPEITARGLYKALSDTGARVTNLNLGSLLDSLTSSGGAS